MSLIIHRNTVSAKYILNNIEGEMGVEEAENKDKDQTLIGYIVCNGQGKYLSVITDKKEFDNGCRGLSLIMVEEHKKAIIFQNREQALSFIDDGGCVCAVIDSDGVGSIYPIIEADDLKVEVH